MNTRTVARARALPPISSRPGDADHSNRIDLIAAIAASLGRQVGLRISGLAVYSPIIFGMLGLVWGIWSHVVASLLEKSVAPVGAPNADWADGLDNISASDAACAFAGVYPSQFETSSKAQAIFKEILAAAQIGWIPNVEALERSVSRPAGGKLALEIIRPGHPNFTHQEPFTRAAMISIKELLKHFGGRDWHTDWARTTA